MKMLSKKKQIVGILILVFISLCFLGYTSFRYKSERDVLEKDLGQSKQRNLLLDQKYKEQKAEATAFQRDNLLLDGQVRKAKADLEQLKDENLGLQKKLAETEEIIKQGLSSCEADREKMLALFEKMKTAHEELKTQHRQTRATLKTREDEVQRLTYELASLGSELKQTTQKKDRYYKHNVALAKIAQALIGQIEKKELGSAIMVKEPFVQFERVELEQLLQDYLDKIDEEKIIP